MQLVQRRGQIVVLAPMLFLVAAAILMLTVDVGRIVNGRARLQNVSDAACLAATQVLLRERIAGTDEETARSLAVAEAERLRNANWPEAGIQVEFGTVDSNGGFTAVDEETPAWATRVHATRNADAPGGELELFFAPLMGMNGTSLATTANAQIAADISGVVRGLRPFAIPQHRIPDIGEEMVFYPGDEETYDEGLGHDQIVPGNWGLLNLNSGSFGSDEVREWIEHGYNMPFLIDPEAGSKWVDGGPGFRATMNRPLQDQVGNSFLMVVYDEVIGSGSNAQFRCVGFVRATITGARLVGNNPYVRCRIEDIEALRDVVAGAGGFESPNVVKVQLMW